MRRCERCSTYGFTLVEVSVSMLILGLITFSLAAMLMASTNIYANETGHIHPWVTSTPGKTDTTSDQVITEDQNTTLKMLQKDLREAVKVVVRDPNTTGTGNTWIMITQPAKANYLNNVLPNGNNLGTATVWSVQPSQTYVHYFLGSRNAVTPTPSETGDSIFRATSTQQSGPFSGAQLLLSGVESVPQVLDPATKTWATSLIFREGTDNRMWYVTLTVQSYKTTLHNRTTVQNPLTTQFFARNATP